MQRHAGEVEVTPAPRLAAVVPLRHPAAAPSAARDLCRRLDVADEAVLREFDAGDAGELDSEESVEQGGSAHGRSAPRLVW